MMLKLFYLIIIILLFVEFLGVIKISCYSPAFCRYYLDNDTGELKAQYIGSIKAKEFLAKAYDGQEHQNIFLDGHYLDSFVQIPCGKCIGCRIDYSRSWADRMTYHSIGKEENSYFITLTYDDEHIQKLDFSPIYDLYSIDMQDISDFIKALRNKFRDNEIQFYASSEYGDSNFRPHFHLIVYNLDIPDLEFWKLDNEKQPIFTSEIIHSLWKKGICSISKFAWLNAAYTASYVEKKRDGRLSCEYSAVGLSPETCRMSRKPGIAYKFYKQNSIDIWNNNGLDVDRTVNKTGHLGIPRYFHKLAIKEGSKAEKEAFFAWKEERRKNMVKENEFFLKNSSFDLSRVSDMLKFQEREILSRNLNKKL